MRDATCLRFARSAFAASRDARYEALVDLGAIRKPLRAAGFAALTASSLVLLTARERLTASDGQTAVLARHKKRYFGAMLQLFGADLEVLNGPPPPATRARLVIANHRSALDIGVLMWLFDAQVLSRGDLANWPLVGYGARRLGTLFVDRADQASRAGAVRVMRRALQAGRTIVVFAEGTTFGGDEVRAFHPGAFLAARGLDVEILPVGLAYEPGADFASATFGAHVVEVAARRSSRVVANIGTPITPVRDPRVTAEHVRDAVVQLVVEARRKV